MRILPIWMSLQMDRIVTEAVMVLVLTTLCLTEVSRDTSVLILRSSVVVLTFGTNVLVPLVSYSTCLPNSAAVIAYCCSST